MLKCTMGINADAKVDIKEPTAKVKFIQLNAFLVKEMMFYICKLPKSPACISEGKSKQWFARFLGSPFVLCLTGRRVDT